MDVLDVFTPEGGVVFSPEDGAEQAKHGRADMCVMGTCTHLGAVLRHVEALLFSTMSELLVKCMLMSSRSCIASVGIGLLRACGRRM